MPKTNKPVVRRFWEKVDRRAGRNGCWTWKGAVNSCGYGSFSLNGNIMPAHRVAAIFKFGSDAVKDRCVCHKCDNRLCVNSDHFFFGTVGDNNKDRHLKGRSRGKSWPGEKNHMAKFSEEQIREIFTSGDPPRVVAKKFKTEPSYITQIRGGRTWRQVTRGLKRGFYYQPLNANERAARP